MDKKETFSPNNLSVSLDLSDKFTHTLAQEVLKQGKKNLITTITAKVIEIKKSEILEPVFTIKEIAKNTKISISTIRRHIDHGYLKAFGPGSQNRITASAYKDYINGRYEDSEELMNTLLQ
ncbi:DNA binding domain-containing protein, excisionase family [Tenacibaculum sp. MAR_2009_124]|uniref:helix-turn-helix domain-containing protein n=1 Tax=Tenacibaculum sp. MAR_2009_124 TaxID=1250059 RepID=UPI00089B4B96|nr:helix-turn-helix domain-containing protein [Tenacibaculum sp. MAR_2009_124]SED09360.1 DNA binding domain-containing protein, excisionase family [Tenacibaculum sp. MAR_2009_124]